MTAARPVKVTVTGEDLAALHTVIEHALDPTSTRRADMPAATAAALRVVMALRSALDERAARDLRRSEAISAAMSPAVAGRIFALRHEGIVPTIDHTNRTDRAGFGSGEERL